MILSSLGHLLASYDAQLRVMPDGDGGGVCVVSRASANVFTVRLLPVKRALATVCMSVIGYVISCIVVQPDVNRKPTEHPATTANILILIAFLLSFAQLRYKWFPYKTFTW